MPSPETEYLISNSAYHYSNLSDRFHAWLAEHIQGAINPIESGRKRKARGCLKPNSGRKDRKTSSGKRIHFQREEQVEVCHIFIDEDVAWPERGFIKPT